KSAGDRPAWSATVWPLSRARVDGAVERSALLLLCAVGCLLLIACVNVAGILLARAAGRRREGAIRLAIGAPRGRLVRLLLTESLLLASIAGVCGTVVAAWGVDVLSLPAITPSSGNMFGVLSTFSAPSLDWWTLLFAFGATAATTIACGLLPAL